MEQALKRKTSGPSRAVRTGGGDFARKPTMRPTTSGGSNSPYQFHRNLGGSIGGSASADPSTATARTTAAGLGRGTLTTAPTSRRPPSPSSFRRHRAYSVPESSSVRDWWCARDLPQLRAALKALGVTACLSRHSDYQAPHLLRALLERAVYRSRINPLLALSIDERGKAVGKWSDLPEDVVPLTKHLLSKEQLRRMADASRVRSFGSPLR